MKQKVRKFLQTDQGKRLVYEVKSFAMTFGTVLVGLVGVDKFSGLDVIISNREVIIGSFSLALSRTAAIYALDFFGLGNYRQNTKDYN